MKDWVAYPGSPYPLGATWDGSGVNFALFSEHADRVELCLFDQPTARRRRRASGCTNRPITSGTSTCPK
jgi:pullulanase/glycogen debranching enzyme